jgi:hypothetical protein
LAWFLSIALGTRDERGRGLVMVAVGNTISADFVIVVERVLEML